MYPISIARDLGVLIPTGYSMKQRINKTAACSRLLPPLLSY